MRQKMALIHLSDITFETATRHLTLSKPENKIVSEQLKQELKDIQDFLNRNEFVISAYSADELLEFIKATFDYDRSVAFSLISTLFGKKGLNLITKEDLEHLATKKAEIKSSGAFDLLARRTIVEGQTDFTHLLIDEGFVDPETLALKAPRDRRLTLKQIQAFTEKCETLSGSPDEKNNTLLAVVANEQVDKTIYILETYFKPFLEAHFNKGIPPLKSMRSQALLELAFQAYSSKCKTKDSKEHAYNFLSVLIEKETNPKVIKTFITQHRQYPKESAGNILFYLARTGEWDLYENLYYQNSSSAHPVNKKTKNGRTLADFANRDGRINLARLCKNLEAKENRSQSEPAVLKVADLFKPQAAGPSSYGHTKSASL